MTHSSAQYVREVLQRILRRVYLVGRAKNESVHIEPFLRKLLSLAR